MRAPPCMVLLRSLRYTSKPASSISASRISGTSQVSVRNTTSTLCISTNTRISSSLDMKPRVFECKSVKVFNDDCGLLPGLLRFLEQESELSVWEGFQRTLESAYPRASIQKAAPFIYQTYY